MRSESRILVATFSALRLRAGAVSVALAAFASLLCVAAWVGAASAEILLVRQDGSGDYLTIAEGLAAASSGDEVRVGPGTYNEWDLVGPPYVRIVSEAGAEATIVDAQDSGYGFVALEPDGLHEVDGFTVLRGRDGAISIQGGGTQTIRNCVVAFSGAGVYGYQFNGLLQNVTAVYNQSELHSGSGFSFSYSYVVIENCISAFNEGYGLVSWSIPGAVSCSCCDIFANDDGDWEGLGNQTGVQGNIAADPRICDPSMLDFRLAGDSPCLPGQHPGGYDCGLIGALGRGCEAIPVQSTTWGQLKALFR